MWSLIRSLLFPVSCIGCEREGIALCEACAPPPHAALVFEIDGVPVLAAGAYEHTLRRAVIAMKRGERAYLDAFAGLLARGVPPGVTLVPLPTTAGRAAQRGFDQSVELARRAAGRAGVPFAHVLAKHGGPQQGQGRARRLGARGRFTLRRGVAPPPAHALLLDDVCTTGGTIAAAVAALRAAGGGVAGAIVLAAARAEPSAFRRGHPVRTNASSRGASA